MRNFKQFKASLQTIVAVVIALTLAGALASTICSAQTALPTTSPQTNSVDTNIATAPSGLTGAELYSIHCNRCHAERYPTERTAANWKTINLHMQIRANIPPAQARLILKYLQDNSGR